MIADLFLRVVEISISSSMIIGILLLMVPILQKRYRVQWRYVVWIVISARLLIPINFILPVIPYETELTESITDMAISDSNKSKPQSIIKGSQTVHITAEAEVVGEEKSILEPIQIIAIIWLAGIIVFLLIQWISYLVFIKKMKCWKGNFLHESVMEEMLRIGQEMGMRKLPEIVITDAVKVPMLTGVFHSRILLPYITYSSEEICFILHHELSHCRRKDMWYKLLLLLATAVHWFNPAIYLMAAQASRDIECNCDSDVIKNLNYNERIRYASTILSIIPRKEGYQHMFSAQFGGSKQNVKNRLHNLFDVHKKRRGTAAIFVLMLSLIFGTGMVRFTNEAATINTPSGKWASVSIASNAWEKQPVKSKQQIEVPISNTDFSIERLGQYALKKGDTLNADLRWDGNGCTLLLYTDNNLTDNQILKPLQGIQGIPKPGKDNKKKEKLGETFNFSSSPLSPLKWNKRITASDNYYIYLIRINNPGQVNGSVNIHNADSAEKCIWPLKKEDGKNQ